MTKRIKSLYIITIIAIVSFLGMQAYWLYGRYEFALSDYERSLRDRVMKCVDDYNVFRETHTDPRADSVRDKGSDSAFCVPSFSLQQQYGDSVRITRTARIYTYLFSAHELLGLPKGAALTEEQKKEAIALAQIQTAEPADSAVFDASGAKDESEAWIATRNVQTQRQSPFIAEGLDSVMDAQGIKARISMAQADSAVWAIRTAYHSSPFRPEITLTIPYSQLEGRTVSIVCPINPFDVLPGMWLTLVITLLVSCLLIVCLVFQVATILRLTRLDRMRNGFITTMVHELKRPVSTLKMCVSGLGSDGMMADGEARKEILSATRSALDNLSAYFSRLRDITFNRVDQIPLNIQCVNLHALFDTVAAAVPVPSGKSVAVDNAIDPELEVSADRSHLYNILTNLVENALKYSGQTVEIAADAVVADGAVSLSVSDTGNGIPPGDLRHIFNRFYRGKASAGSQPGMGLGLAYVKLLVEAHGGSVAAVSRIGEGSRFTITLPQ